MEHYEINGASLRSRQNLLHGNASETRQSFQGLPEGVTHIELLNLLKSVYREIGLGDSEMLHLEYMLIRTQPQDWQENQRPVFYQSVQRIAEERGLTTRQVNNIENHLEALELITWSDRGNYKRGGFRGESGKIMYAYGVDLSPLATRYHEMLILAAQKQEYMNHMQRLRVKSGILSRRISVLRKQIAYNGDIEVQCAADSLIACYRKDSFRRSERLSEAELYERMEMQQKYILQMELLYKTHLPNDKKASQNVPINPNVKIEANSHVACELPVNISYTSEENFRHIYNNTNNHSSKEEILCNHVVDNVDKKECALTHNSAPPKIAFGNAGHAPFQKKNPISKIDNGSKKVSPSPALFSSNSIIRTKDYPNGESGRIVNNIGMEHLTPKMAMHAMSPAFEHHLPVGYDGFSWHEIIQAAEIMVPLLSISSHAWKDACGVLGRTGASICILIADARAEKIKSYGGFIRACVRKAQAGELHLHKTIFGLMKRRNQEVM